MDGFLTFKAPAKVNLFLHITGRRADGYHLLQSAFRLLDFYDSIHLNPSNNGKIRRVNALEGVPAQQDLCVRAAALLQQHTGCKKGVDITVDKRIAIGGGLGGGSSDAATVLLALNRLWDLHLSRAELLALGLQLGADVPVFIFGKNAWAEGIGEQLQAIELPPAYYAVLTPPVHVSTAQVFASKELTRNTIPTTIAPFSRVLDNKLPHKLIDKNVLAGSRVNIPEGAFFRDFYHNDLEPVVCRQYPAVAVCLDWLNQFVTARMSGSGASVFAEFASQAAAEKVLANAMKPTGINLSHGFVARGLDRHPLYEFAD